MEPTDALVASLQRAVDAMPDDVALRAHLAAVLVDAGRGSEAVAHCAAVLQRDPENAAARELMVRALGDGPPAAPAPVSPVTPSADPRPQPPAPSTEADPSAPPSGHAFDWGAAEQDLGGPQAMFVGDPELPAVGAFEVERVGIRLADVAGMADVKERLELSFLGPMRNPRLRALYGKSLRGGMLLYGPPGCGKTFIARALAGEMGARFITVGLNDVLDMYLGNSEKQVHELFVAARAAAPVVLFLDEVDALGQRRTQHHSTAMRGVVNQLLLELDGVETDNEGVYVVAATNQPWDVDPALRRPGRFDRTLLVLPPDEPARAGIFAFHLKDRPVEGIDLQRLAAASPGLTGADIAWVCENAAERALMDSVRTGHPRLIGMPDLHAALAETRPSTTEWFGLARNVVTFADPDGTYADLKAYMKKARLL